MIFCPSISLEIVGSNFFPNYYFTSEANPNWSNTSGAPMMRRATPRRFHDGLQASRSTRSHAARCSLSRKVESLGHLGPLDKILTNIQRWISPKTEHEQDITPAQRSSSCNSRGGSPHWSEQNSTPCTLLSSKSVISKESKDYRFLYGRCFVLHWHWDLMQHQRYGS